MEFKKFSTFRRILFNNTILLAAALESDVTTTDGKLITQLTNKDENSRVYSNVSFAMDLWLILAEVLNFKTKFVFREKEPGGRASVVALRNLVRQGKAQLTMSPTIFTNETVRGLELSQPVDIERYRAFIHARADELGWQGIGTVFTSLLWMAIAGTIIFLAMVLMCIESTGRWAKLPGYMNSVNPGQDKGQIVMVIIGNLCYQGSIQIASACAGRVLVFTSLMFCWLIYISYSVFIISLQTTTTLQPPVQSLEELAARSNFRLITVFDPTLLDTIQVIHSDKQHSLNSLWHRLLPVNLTSSHVYDEVTPAMSALCLEHVALLAAEHAITGSVLKKAGCKVMSMKPRYFTSDLGLVFEPNTTISKIFQKTLLRMRETGLIHKWRTYWDRVTGVNTPPPEDPGLAFTTIGFREVAPAFLILAVGAVLSLGILVLEMASSIAWMMWQQRRAARSQTQAAQNARDRHYNQPPRVRLPFTP